LTFWKNSPGGFWKQAGDFKIAGPSGKPPDPKTLVACCLPDLAPVVLRLQQAELSPRS